MGFLKYWPGAAQVAVFALLLSPCVPAVVSDEHGGPSDDAVVRQEVWKAVQAACFKPDRTNDSPIRNDDLAVPTWPTFGNWTAFAVSEVRWDPVLQVVRIRLRCQPAGGCLPFFIYVHPVPSVVSRLVTHNDELLCGQRLGVRDPASQKSPGESLAVKPGTEINLMSHYRGARLRQPVDCLDRGAVGDVVRVRLRFNGHILRATVVGPGLARSVEE